MFTGYKDVSDPEALASGPRGVPCPERPGKAGLCGGAGRGRRCGQEACRGVEAPAPVESAEAQATTVVAAAAPMENNPTESAACRAGRRTYRNGCVSAVSSQRPQSLTLAIFRVRQSRERRCRLAATTCIWPRCARRPRSQHGRTPPGRRRTRRPDFRAIGAVQFAPAMARPAPM